MLGVAEACMVYVHGPPVVIPMVLVSSVLLTLCYHSGKANLALGSNVTHLMM